MAQQKRISRFSPKQKRAMAMKNIFFEGNIVEDLEPFNIKEFSCSHTLGDSYYHYMDFKIDYYMTLREIGIVLGISWERVRQIEQKALEKLRKAYIKNKINYFLH